MMKATLKVVRQLGLPFAHENEGAFDGLTVIDELQFADGRGIVPLEMVGEEG